MFEDQVDVASQGVLRAQQYLRIEELRKQRYELQRDTYKNSGVILSEEELHEKI